MPIFFVDTLQKCVNIQVIKLRQMCSRQIWLLTKPINWFCAYYIKIYKITQCSFIPIVYRSFGYEYQNVKKVMQF